MISVRPPAVGGRLGWISTALGSRFQHTVVPMPCWPNLTRPISSPPTSKRIKTSTTTSAPPHLLAQQQIHPFHRVPTFEGIPIPSAPLPTQQNPGTSRKRPPSPASGSVMMASPVNPGVGAIEDPNALPAVESTPKKKGRTNTPWTAEEEQRLKTMRDAGRSWSEIAKVRARGAFAFFMGMNLGR